MSEYTSERVKAAESVAEDISARFGLNAEEIWLYGSVARGEDKKESDIDILCLFLSNLLPTDPFGYPLDMRDFVSETELKYLSLGHKVSIELMDLNQFHKRIISERENPGEDYEKNYATNALRERKVLHSSEMNDFSELEECVA